MSANAGSLVVKRGQAEHEPGQGHPAVDVQVGIAGGRSVHGRAVGNWTDYSPSSGSHAIGAGGSPKKNTPRRSSVRETATAPPGGSRNEVARNW